MITTHDASDCVQDQAFVGLDSVPTWMVTIKPSRVAGHLRAEVVRYPREVKAVLARAFLGPNAAAEGYDPLDAVADPAIANLQPARANSHLARRTQQEVAGLRAEGAGIRGEVDRI